MEIALSATLTDTANNFTMRCTATHRIEKGETATAVFAKCAPEGGFRDDMGVFPGRYRYKADLVVMDSDFMTAWEGKERLFAAQVQQFWYCGQRYAMTWY